MRPLTSSYFLSCPARFSQWVRAGSLVCALLLLAAPAQPARVGGGPSACASQGTSGCIPGIVRLRTGRTAADKHSTMDLAVGHTLVLETTFLVSRVAVGDPNIADVLVIDTHQVNIVPLNSGQTNLILWNKAGDVQAVVDLDVGRTHAYMERQLRRILENDSLVVEGTGDSIVLKGVVESPIHMQQTLDAASALAGGSINTDAGTSSTNQGPQIINLLKVGGNQQVMIEVIIAEMDRKLTRKLGTNLAGVYGSGGTDVNLFSLLQGISRLENSAAPKVLDLSSRVNFISTISRGSDSLDIFIEAIQADGLIKILAEPNLVARSGATAEFLVGGEIPIPIPQSGSFGTITVEFKPFGVGVQFTPTVLGSDRIYVDVSTEVSEPNETLGLNSGGVRVPGFNTRRAATAVELRDGESFAIAGLLRDDVSETITEFPGLGEIPIFGALFRSTAFERKQTELVIIATPRLVRPGPIGRPALPTDHFVIPTALEFFLHGSMEARAQPDEEKATTQAPAEVPASSGSPKDPDSTPKPSVSAPAEPAGQLKDAFAGPVGHSLDLQAAEGDLP